MTMNKDTNLEQTAKVEPIETDLFKDAPTFTSVAVNMGEGQVLDALFISLVANEKGTAETELLREMKKLHCEPFLKVVGFLVKPSTLAIVSPLAEGEEPDGFYHFGAEPIPGKKHTVAFCFFFGTYKGVPLTRDTLQTLGIRHVVLEGQIGSRVDK